jgi:hypothetical protein
MPRIPRRERRVYSINEIGKTRYSHAEKLN